MTPTPKDQALESLKNSGRFTIPKKDLIDKGEYFEFKELSYKDINMIERAIDIALTSQREETAKEIDDYVNNKFRYIWGLFSLITSIDADNLQKIRKEWLFQKRNGGDESFNEYIISKNWNDFNEFIKSKFLSKSPSKGSKETSANSPKSLDNLKGDTSNSRGAK